MRVGNTVYMSGQIPLDPATMQLVSGDIDAEITRVFDNLRAVATAAGGTLDNAVKVTVFLTDLAHFARVNEIMATYFKQPYPARAAVGVAALPRGARVEMECILESVKARAPQAATPAAMKVDPLFLLPSRYEDRTRVTPIGSAASPASRAVVEGEVHGGRCGVPPSPRTAGAHLRRLGIPQPAVLLLLARAAGRPRARHA